jgi:hypothetical protein
MATPAKSTEVNLSLRISNETAEALDSYRAGLRPLRSRAAVARTALAEYLKLREVKAAAPKVPVVAVGPAPAKSWR